MKHILISALVAGALAVPALADETPPETLPPPAPAPAPAPACGMTEKCKTSYNLHWLEREVPHTQTKYNLRDVVTPATKHGLEIEYKKEQRTRTVMVLKPQEVVKEVTVRTQIPKVVKDPCTGCATVVFEPFTETKQVKERCYCLVPEEQVYTVQTGCLKEVDKPIGIKTLALDCVTETVTKKERFGVVVPVEIKERKPPCPCPVPAPCAP